MCTATKPQVRSYSREIQVLRPGAGPISTYGLGRAVWLSCAVCGRSKPTVYDKIVPTRMGGTDHQGFHAKIECPKCGVAGELLTFDLRDNPRKPERKSECSGPCLAGKRSCDCRCRGRCHGAGVCSCGTHAEATAA